MKIEAKGNKKKSMLKASIAFVGVAFLCLIFIGLTYNNQIQKKLAHAAEHYILFENKIQQMLCYNFSLIQGFEAYVIVNTELEAEDAYRYLDTLIMGNFSLIRNIGIMEGTTLKWNYPIEGNEEAIGKDLSKIEGQKDQVLKVKNELVSVLHGPIDLVQGGKGFSLRKPLLKDGEYWGQTSIVIKLDELMAEIQKYADEAEIEIAISGGKSDQVFFGDEDIKNQAFMTFKLDPSLTDWVVYLKEPASHDMDKIILGATIVLSILLSFAVAIIAYIHSQEDYIERYMSTRDYMTGLYNRRYLDTYVKDIGNNEKNGIGKWLIIMADLNGLKLINDNYGHAAGDEAIIAAGKTMVESTDEKSVIFRIGGDEFLALIPGAGPEESEDIMERIKNAFEGKFGKEQVKVKVGISLGYASYPHDGKNFDDLLKIADERLYKDKLN